MQPSLVLCSPRCCYLFLCRPSTGHIIFTLAMGWGFFWMAVFGEAVYGLGSGAVVVAMRAVVSQFFLANELTFGMVRGATAPSCVRLYTGLCVLRNFILLVR